MMIEKSDTYTIPDAHLLSVIDVPTVRAALVSFCGRDDLRCPDCNSAPTAAQRKSLIAGGRARCKCATWYSWSTATPYSKTKLSPGQIYILLACRTAGVEVKQAAKLAYCHTDTARTWYRKEDI